MELRVSDRRQPGRRRHPGGARIAGARSGRSRERDGALTPIEGAPEPGPQDPAWPRYSSRAFPPYRFVPGLYPHPHRDPGGHSYGTAAPILNDWSPAEWRSLEPYLYGIDLYNFAYWWEAHEVLEGLWHAAGRTSPHARFVQGIIHVAAANLNLFRGNAAAGRRQARRGIDRLRQHAGRVWMGIEVDEFVGKVEGYLADRSRGPALIQLRFFEAP